jgi:single-strand DNA-binding protein
VQEFTFLTPKNEAAPSTKPDQSIPEQKPQQPGVQAAPEQKPQAANSYREPTPDSSNVSEDDDLPF